MKDYGFATGDSPSEQPWLGSIASIQDDVLSKLGPNHTFQQYLDAIKKVDWSKQIAQKLGQPEPPTTQLKKGPLPEGILGQISTLERGKSAQTTPRSPLPNYSMTPQPQVPSPYQQPVSAPMTGYSGLPSYGRNPFYQQLQGSGFNYY